MRVLFVCCRTYFLEGNACKEKKQKYSINGQNVMFYFVCFFLLLDMIFDSEVVLLFFLLYSISQLNFE